MHLDAHRLLATALAQTGEPAAAVDHLVTALAADYFKYGPSARPTTKISKISARRRTASRSRRSRRRSTTSTRSGSRAACWVVGRRSPFKWPEGTRRPDRVEPRRALRVRSRDASDSCGSPTPITRSPASCGRRPGREIAVIGFDKVDHPKADDQPPLFARPWLRRLRQRLESDRAARQPAERARGLGRLRRRRSAARLDRTGDRAVDRGDPATVGRRSLDGQARRRSRSARRCRASR